MEDEDEDEGAEIPEDEQNDSDEARTWAQGEDVSPPKAGSIYGDLDDRQVWSSGDERKD